ncbi:MULTISPECIES: ACT domain-containing protein [Dietzia]|nr:MULTISPECIES: amino acid-binding protein [Dietzia]KZO59685.1 amino acid-binding protein [Dietzia maris]MBM7229426.1 amino acid-binding protein [Dietzia cinnamea]MBS7547143.1 amino acid-binding protein [Dietzia massiliensis]MCT1639007.1 amino acid-binding protein [Dietzia cinnamea]MCT1863618.1 amino acid-binding protein [Dietzia cinnamea]
MSYLLRVMLPDRPGSLGSLAVALGTVDADIVSLDVVDRFDGVAVDDIVVDVPHGTFPDTLITAAERLDGVVVDSLRPFGGILDAHRELELIDAVAGAGAGAAQMLADEIPAALRVGWALVLEVTGDATCRLVARGESAPMWEGGEVPVVCGLARVTALDDDDEVPAEWTAMDTALAAAPLNAGHVLVVGRPGGPSFRPSEIARLGYLTGILRSLHAG